MSSSVMELRFVELHSQNNGEKLGTAMLGVVPPKGTNRHPLPYPTVLASEAITPRSLGDIHQAACLLSLIRQTW